MQIRYRGLAIPSLTALIGLVPLTAADGTRLIGIGAAQVGNAGAGVASPQDSTWLQLDPAALIDVKGQANIGSDLITATATLAPQGPLGNAAAGQFDDRVFVAAPQATLSTSWGDSALAFGAFAMSGLVVDYPDSRSSFGAGGGYDRRAQSSVTRMALAYSRKVVDDWAVGVSLDLDYAEFRSDSLTGALTETSGHNDLDHSLGGGFAVGLYRRWDQASIGVTYTSRQWMQRYRRYADLFESCPDQPQEIQAGVAWRPLPWLEPLFDYRYIDWEGVKVFGDSTAGFGWKSQHIFMLACNAYAREDLVLRAGVSYGRSPIRSSMAFTNGLTPLVTEWHATAGATWHPSTHYSVQAAYLHGFKKSVVDDGSDVGGFGKGTRISLVVDALVVGLGYVF